VWTGPDWVREAANTVAAGADGADGGDGGDGGDVTLPMPAFTSPIPPGVGLRAYRIVQESLSNAGRHAPGAAISVVVRVEPLAVRVKVTNGPATASPPRKDGTGHGRAAMISCLIADDQAMVREGFGALLAAQPGLMPVMDGLSATRAQAVVLAYESGLVAPGE
jgi:hypothetical protein